MSASTHVRWNVHFSCFKIMKLPVWCNLRNYILWNLNDFLIFILFKILWNFICTIIWAHCILGWIINYNSPRTIIDIYVQFSLSMFNPRSQTYFHKNSKYDSLSFFMCARDRELTIWLCVDFNAPYVFCNFLQLIVINCKYFYIINYK